MVARDGQERDQALVVMASAAFGSTRMPGPIVVLITARRTNVPLAAVGRLRRTVSITAAMLPRSCSSLKLTLPMG